MDDQFGRKITYLRLSITPRCNLNCFYCRPGNCPPEQSTFSAYDLLTAAEFGRIVRAAAALGIRKIRLTGGEPLMRPDLEEIIRLIRLIPEIEDLSMTTNGQGLAEKALSLRQAGLDRVNLSLDSLQQDRFRQITGGGILNQVLSAIDACLTAGLTPLKLNTVLVRGVNDDEVADLIELTRDRPLAVRFIELMPMNQVGRNDDRLITGTEILAAFPDLQRLPAVDPSAPSEDFRIPGYQGTVGLIRPISHRFCAACNRIRITADGMLKPCLGDLGEVSLRPALATGDDTALLQLMGQVIFKKPEGHSFSRSFSPARSMDRTGG